MVEKSSLTLLRFVIFSLIFVSFIASAVLAVHVIRTNANTVMFRPNEDLGFIYNISVNISDVTGVINNANVTQVNITLPSNFTFIFGSNYTTTSNNANLTFSNTSIVLSWGNLTSFLLNASASVNFFWFNATVATPGSYNISVTTLNATGPTTSNITVVINDTTTPSSVEYVSPTNSSFVNMSQNAIPVNITGADNGVVDRILVNLYNSSNYLLNASYATSASSFFINFTGLSDGTYKINATINDTYANINYTATRTIILDRTSPANSFSCSDTTVDEDDNITCTCSATDATTGVVSTTFTASPSTSQTGTFTTTCTSTDYAGNSATSEIEYTVDGGGNYASSSSGGGSSSNSNSDSDNNDDSSDVETSPPADDQNTWETTDESDQELSAKGNVRTYLRAQQRVSIKVAEEIHHVSVISVTATSAVIEIASTPQQVTMNVGETKKFEVTNDDYYDVAVTLESIVGGEAQITMTSINEKMASVSGAGGSNNMYWIIGIVVLLIVAVGAWFYYQRK